MVQTSASMRVPGLFAGCHRSPRWHPNLSARPAHLYCIRCYSGGTEVTIDKRPRGPSSSAAISKVSYFSQLRWRHIQGWYPLSRRISICVSLGGFRKQFPCLHPPSIRAKTSPSLSSANDLTLGSRGNVFTCPLVSSCIREEVVVGQYPFQESLLCRLRRGHHAGSRRVFATPSI